MKSPLHATRILLAAAMLALAAGCASTPTQESFGEYVDDTSLTTRVKSALLADKEVSGLAINVETFKGIVQLSGFAKTEAERKRAHDLAHDIKGVKSVKNDILLK
jgi:osmotically-inducible protein OsmY